MCKTFIRFIYIQKNYFTPKQQRTRSKQRCQRSSHIEIREYIYMYIKDDEIYVTQQTEPGIIWLKRAQVSVQYNLGDIKTESAFAPLIIHGNALANVSGVSHEHHTRIRVHAVDGFTARGYTHVGGTGMCANERQRRIVLGSLTCICMCMYGKEKSSITFEAIQSWQWWTDDVLGIVSLWTRARHKIDERLWLIYYALKKKRTKFVMIERGKRLFFIRLRAHFKSIVLEIKSHSSDYKHYEYMYMYIF